MSPAEEIQRRAEARQAALDCVQLLLAGVTDLDIGDAARFERCMVAASATLADHVAELEARGSL